MIRSFIADSVIGERVLRIDESILSCTSTKKTSFWFVTINGAWHRVSNDSRENALLVASGRKSESMWPLLPVEGDYMVLLARRIAGAEKVDLGAI